MLDIEISARCDMKNWLHPEVVWPVPWLVASRSHLRGGSVAGGSPGSGGLVCALSVTWTLSPTMWAGSQSNIARK